MVGLCGMIDKTKFIFIIFFMGISRERLKAVLLKV